MAIVSKGRILRAMAKTRKRSVSLAQLLTLLLAFLLFSGTLGLLSAGLLVPAAGSAAVVTKTVPKVFEDLPGDLQIVQPAEESVMLDAGGNIIARFYDKQRVVVASDQIAATMKAAIVAIEDKRFYEHVGVDATGIGRAFINNLGGSGTQGASTITQQFVRNALQERGYLEGDPDLVNSAVEQTPQRKLREMKYAMALERRMSKDEILTGYLNIAPFGPITYGVEAASQRYFSKSAAELDWGQAALLAGLVQSPVEYDPLTNPEAAQTRRDIVLGVMRNEQIITEEEYQQYVAIAVPDQLNPTVTPQGCLGASDVMAYFCTYVVKAFLADESFGATAAERDHLLKTGGLTIRTTIDPTKQQHAYNALVGTIPVDDASDVDTALASLSPSTGQIVAMAQNTAFGLEEGRTMNNYAADGHFQVGSTFKLFSLIQWFKEGHSAYEAVGRANRVYTNGEFTCDGAPYVTSQYRVTDLGGTLKDGPMDVIRATGTSANQAFVNMGTKVDFCGIFQTAADFGFTKEDGSPIDAYPSNILGSAEASPLALAGAYAAIANDGSYCEPQSMTTVTDNNDNVIKEYQPQCREVVTPGVARQVATILTRSTSGYYNATRLAGGRPFAAKSGTTNSNANTWLAGFTPELATAAWVGHANASQTPVNNVTINGRYYSAIYGETFVGQNIWAPYMSAALEGTPITPINTAYIGAPAPAPTPRVETQEQNQTNSGAQATDAPQEATEGD